MKPQRPVSQTLEIYCSNPNCNVREIRVQTKTYGDGDESDPQIWHCPGCGRKAEVHWQHTAKQQRDHDLKDSISFVNIALWQREQRQKDIPEDVLIALPFNVICLETLPDSWHSQECSEEKTP